MKILILIGLIIAYFKTNASTLELKNGQEYFVNAQYYELYKDSSSILQLNEIVFKDFPLKTIDYKVHPDWNRAIFWLKFEVYNNSNSEKWYLEIPDFHIQNVTFYDPQLNIEKATGYFAMFDTREYFHKNYVFELQIPKKTKKVFYVKMSSSKSFAYEFKIRRDQYLLQYSTSEYFFLGCFYGFLILIAFYNLAIYLSLKDRSHLYYFIYILSVGIRATQEDGLGFQYLWPSYPMTNKVLDTIAPLLLFISFSFYTIEFLELKIRFKSYYKLAFGFVFFFLIAFVGKLFLNGNLFIDFVLIIPFGGMYVISMLAFAKGYKPSRFYILGYSLLVFSLVLDYINAIGVFRFEQSFWIIVFAYSVNIGFVIEAFVFSIALSDKLRIFKIENERSQQIAIEQFKVNEELKDKVNKELESKVAQRTEELLLKSEELIRANQQLKEQSDEINRMNQILDIENFKLKSSAQEIKKDRGLLKGLSFDEFSKTFPDELSCFRFIEELKWEEGYTCRNCSNSKYLKGPVPFSRKCSKCNYIETIKANTIFHGIKFPIEKAVQIIYLTLSNDGEESSYDLSDRIQLRQKTCWSFKKKILDKIKYEKISKRDIAENGWSILVCDSK